MAVATNAGRRLAPTEPVRSGHAESEGEPVRAASPARSWAPLAWTEGRRVGRDVSPRVLRRRPARSGVATGRPRVVAGHDRGRPARLVAAPARAAAVPCEPRVAAGSLVWLVVLGAVAFLVVLGIGLTSGGSPDSAAVPQGAQLVQVHQGDTLWSVARRTVPSADPAAVVSRIRSLNNLPGDRSLYPGELLQVPAGH